MAEEETGQQYACWKCEKTFWAASELGSCSHCGAPASALSLVAPTDGELRVLLVDDALIARKKIGGILKSLGCQVVEAGDGEQGMALAAGNDPDLIVLDIHMPKVDGLQMLKALRGMERFASTPVVMLTGEADAQIVAQALQLKISDYIRKDDPIESLKARLRKQIDKLKAK
jgi:CheY-like chemotaxis protein